MTHMKLDIVAFTAVFLVLSSLSCPAPADKEPIGPQYVWEAVTMDTRVLGGVEVTPQDMEAVDKGSHILHGRNGKLSKVQVEKSQLPDETPPDFVEIRTTIAVDGNIYVNATHGICKSMDGGRTWTLLPRGSGPADEVMIGTFQILRDGTFLCVQKNMEGDKKGPVGVWASGDEGRTWQLRSQIKPTQADGNLGPRVYGLFRLPDETLLCGIMGDNYVRSANKKKWVSGKYRHYIYRSTDGGRTWEQPRPFADWASEGGIITLPSGRLLASFRYQRLLLPSDPPGLLEKTGASAYIHLEVRPLGTVLSSHFPYKHHFLADSADGGRTWQNVRRLTTFFGQCFGYPVALSDGTVVVTHDNRYGPPPHGHTGAMISYDEGQTWEDEAYYLCIPDKSQSVALKDDVILTITGAQGLPLKAIRWKPAKD